MTDLTSYTPDQLAQLELPTKAMLAYTGSDNEEQFEIVTIVAWKSGWATVVLSNGDEAKRRATSLYPMEDEQEPGAKQMSQTLAKYRERYVPTVAASGKKSLHNGDPVAMALEYRELEYLYPLAASLLGFEESELRARYAHLNLGAQRMNLGNRIRAAYRRGDDTVIKWVSEQLIAE